MIQKIGAIRRGLTLLLQSLGCWIMEHIVCTNGGQRILGTVDGTDIAC